MVKKRLVYVFALYCFLLMWVILLRMNIEQFTGKYNGIVLVPFSDNTFYVSRFDYYACIIGNVLTFIPMGIYLSLFFRENKFYKRILLSITCVLLASLLLEIIQYVCVIGISSTTDLIHNGIGGLIGIVIYELLRRFVSDKVINSINKWTIIVLIPICAFALINTFININLYI